MSTTDIAALDTEFDQLREEINRVALNTQWNGSAIFPTGSDASSTDFQVGANASQTISVTFANIQSLGDSNEATTDTESIFGGSTLDNDGDGSDDDDDMGSFDLTSSTTAIGPTGTIFGMDSAIKIINGERAKLGAAINRLEYAVDNLSNVSEHFSFSRSRVLDADYLAETTELARTQIIQQAKNSDVVTSKSTSSISS